MTKFNTSTEQTVQPNNEPIVLPEKQIDRIDEISYHNFFTNYLMANKPCIITQLSTQNWRSTKDWVTSSGQPDFDFLIKEFGSSIVPVADCDIKEYNSHHKIDMPFKDYLQYWNDLISGQEKSSKTLYLKDWHFQREHRAYEAYKTLKYFHSDWLNEFYNKEKDDYKFVYMGPKGTWTPLHKDVFGSYSWSANICGRKRWWLFPPGQESFLKDEKNQFMHCVDENSVSKCNVSYFDVIQEPGEVIFVPSGWYHQVWNIENTISINHNWFNGCNILYIWQELNRSASDVEKEISDCKGYSDWEDQWQVILRVHHGFNYAEFFQIIKNIFESRTKYLESLETDDYSKYWEETFDIVSIKTICNEMLKCKLPEELLKHVKCFDSKVEKFISKIKNK